MPLVCAGINRRRIYDIINVFESLELAGKHSKNLYVWYGIEKLPVTLAKLKAIAEFEGPLVFCDKPEVLSNQEFRWVSMTMLLYMCVDAPVKSMTVRLCWTTHSPYSATQHCIHDVCMG